MFRLPSRALELDGFSFLAVWAFASGLVSTFLDRCLTFFPPIGTIETERDYLLFLSIPSCLDPMRTSEILGTRSERITKPS